MSVAISFPVSTSNQHTAPVSVASGGVVCIRAESVELSAELAAATKDGVVAER